jgi:polysaccharide export outer membrane protein
MKSLVPAVFIILSLMSAGSVFADDTNQKAKDHYDLGNDYYQQGKYIEAQEQYQKALALTKEAGPKVCPVVQQKAGAQAVSKKDKELKQSTSKGEYLIGPDDLLYISVWQNDDLSQEATVRPDGKISFPLLGDIQAGGLTIPQLDESLTDKLKEYIKYPEVSVTVRRLGGRKIIVLGQVRYPGVYQVSGAKTLLEGIALAGGFTDDSLAGTTVIIKGIYSGNPKAIRVSANRALNGIMSANPSLDSEDVVFIPKKPIADMNYLITQVTSAVQGTQSASQVAGMY